MSLFRFFQQSGDYLSADEDAISQAGEDGARHGAYHQRIVMISALFGVIGAGLGIAFSIGMASAAEGGKEAKGILVAPFMFCAVGLLFGVTVACLFAPRQFLTGPVGKKWMKLIGTESVLGARIVCLIFGLMVMAPFVGIGLIMALTK